MEFNKETIGRFAQEIRKSCIEDKKGGPFGALVLKEGQIVAVGFNEVTSTNDPTAHAEVQAIRKACKKLNTFDLTGCELYASGFPCPMCMSAIIWANIKKVYYSANYLDAEEIGFRDKHIFDFIKNNYEGNLIEFKRLSKSSIIKIYEEFNEKGELY